MKNGNECFLQLSFMKINVQISCCKCDKEWRSLPGRLSTTWILSLGHFWLHSSLEYCPDLNATHCTHAWLSSHLPGHAWYQTHTHKWLHEFIQNKVAIASQILDFILRTVKLYDAFCNCLMKPSLWSTAVEVTHSNLWCGFPPSILIHSISYILPTKQ